MHSIGRLSALAALIACVVAGTSRAAAGPAAMSLSSSAFEADGAIPQRYTCQGENRSPPLSWSGVPAGARSLALVLYDPDAPSGTWVHWVVYNLPADGDGLPAGASGGLPGGANEGLNSWNEAQYGGPCPPSGQHRYVFTLYALDARLDVDRPGRRSLEAAMDSHVLDRATLRAVYARR